MEPTTWTTELRALYDKAVSLYRDGNRDLSSYFSPEEAASLASIGLKPINVYDYAEDIVKYNEPSWDTFLLVASARRDFFLYEQHGVSSAAEIEESDLPPKPAEIEGIPWLPRIIRKARCFLEGGLCHDIMYGCGGDRGFVAKHHIHLADFLRVVWAARGDDKKIVAFVKKSAGGE